MLVLSAGMEKSGSGWVFNMTNDLLVATGFDDARAIRSRYHLGMVLSEVNCNIRAPTTWKLALVLYPSLLFGRTFAVKTNRAGGISVRWLIAKGSIKATYIYRDPRDVILSALDHGRRQRERGRRDSFAPYKTLEDGVKLMRRLYRIYRYWVATPGVLLLRYEDLVENVEREVERLCAYLDITVPEEEVNRIVQSYSTRRTERKMTHFYKGVAGRFRQDLSPDQIAYVEGQLGDQLTSMGYPRTGSAG